MTDPRPVPLDVILHLIADSAPRPLYPRDYVQATGTQRDGLEPGLEQLRLSGLIRLTDWVEGHGQGYVLTPEGQRALWNPRELGRLSLGKAAPTVPSLGQRDRSGPTTWDRGEAIRDSLLGSFKPGVTFLLLAINVAVFAVGLVIAQRDGVAANEFLSRSSIKVLEETGAVSIGDLIRGQWWRLLTCCFVHIGGLHILVNMYALFGFGQLIERLFGHWRYLLIYLIAGFGGSCTGVLVQPGILAGASGALCGLLGAMGAWAFLNRHHVPAALVANMRRNLMINTLLLVFISAMPGIGWGAHLGGAVFGLLAAGLVNIARYGRRWQGTLAWFGVLLLPILSFAAVLEAPRFDEPWAIEEMNEKYLPEVNHLDEAAENAVRNAGVERLIFRTRALRRKPETVEEAVAALTKARAQLDEAAAFLEQAGPYRSHRVALARQLRLDLLRERGKLYAMYQECLEQKEECAAEDRRLPEQDEKIHNLFLEYKKVLQPE